MSDAGYILLAPPEDATKMPAKSKKEAYLKAIKCLLCVAVLIFAAFIFCIYVTVKHWPSADKAISKIQNARPFLEPRHKTPSEILQSPNFFEFDKVPMNWRLNFSSQFKSSPGYEFKPVYDNGVYSLPDICIEDTPKGWDKLTFEVPETLANGSVRTRTVSMPTKHLVGYNALFDCNIRIKVSAGPNMKESDKVWWITFVKDPVPADRTVITNHTAFFILPTCEGNLHHFWQDSTFGLYGAMKATNRLDSRVKNQLFYKQPQWDLDRSDGCHNPGRYEEFLYTFSIRTDHETFHKKPHGTCYQHAVFGSYMKGFWAGEPEGYVVNKMGGNYTNCPHPYLVILQRSNRKLLNAEAVLAAAKSLGINNSFVLLFEELTLRQQVFHIACADYLIGIQGAGLQWLRFMKYGGGLLEIAWPRLGWGYFYQELANFARLEYEAIEANEVMLNFTTYSLQVRHGRPVPLKEQWKMKGSLPKNSYDNHWKWADVKVDPKTFKTKLGGLIRRVQKNRSNN